ncbi:MAG: hypothetical protein GZ089_06395 [Aromatoleum sp.]|nr:hypothetical protein [Aromatoleum sp.]
MKTGVVTAADLARSVLAVPPLARHADLTLDPDANRALIRYLETGDYARAEALRAAYLPLENLRDELSPIRVLHEAVRLAGIADTGPMLPQLTNIPASLHPRIAAAAKALLAHDRALP